MAEPGRRDIVAVRGDDYAHLIRVVDSASVPFSISGYSAEAPIWHQGSDRRVAGSMSVDLTSASDGYALLRMTDLETDALPAKKYDWAFVTTISDFTQTWVSGTFKLVNRAGND